VADSYQVRRQGSRSFTHFTQNASGRGFRYHFAPFRVQHNAILRSSEFLFPIGCIRGIAWGVFNLSGKPPCRVAGILVNRTGPANDSAEKLLADVRPLPGETSILITPRDGGKPLLSYNADRQLGIGSAFRLYVLSTLARQVAAGKRSWSDVVTIITNGQPSGASRDWPEGAPITLHIDGPFYVGIGFCSHQPTTLDTALLSDVVIENRAGGVR